jgi:hypothetical protein
MDPLEISWTLLSTIIFNIQDYEWILLCKTWAFIKIIQNHNTNCINLQYSCLLCPSTRDQAFNHIEKYASGKQPDIYFKNSALFYPMHNIQLNSKGVFIQSDPVDNINSLHQNQQLLSATC